MRSRFLAIALLATALPGEAQAFEGVLHMVMTMPTVAPVKTDVSIRHNGDSRTDTFVPFLNQKVSFIQRGSAPIIQIMHATKQYTESSYLQGKASSDAANALQDATVRDLPVETIAGYICRHALITNKSGATIEVWVTGSIPSNSSVSSIAGGGDALMQTLKKHGLDGFPLKLKMVEQGLPITLETTSVETRAVDSALFTIPSGYTKVSESDMSLRDLSPEEMEVLKAFERQLKSQMSAE